MEGSLVHFLCHSKKLRDNIFFFFFFFLNYHPVKAILSVV